MKKYKFNDQIYTDLDSLTQAFINDFEAAQNAIFVKPRKLVAFVKSFDKAKAKKIVEIFEATKYKGNVLSFIIFTLSKDPIVLINGVNLDFNDFIKVIGMNRDNKAVKAFMEDHGMSKTYATMEIDKKIPNDSYYIEKTFEDEFTYKYIANYLKTDYTENLNGFISNILINDDERFRRACEVVTSDDFQMVLAHKANFKAAYNIRYSVNPIFDAIKMLAIEFNKDDLLKIISDTFFSWLLDNFDKYTYYKKETILLRNQLKKLKKESQKNLTFEEKVELSRRLYEIYLLFAEGYNKKEIYVNTKKYNLDQYALDKPYCKTLICVDYMKNHPVVLTTAEELKALEKEKAKAEEPQVEEPTEEIKEKEEKLNNDVEVEVIKDIRPTEKQLKLSEKRQKKLRRMTKYISITTVVAAIVLALIYFVLPLLPQKAIGVFYAYVEAFNANKSKLMIYTFVALGVIAANLILIAVINIRNSVSAKAVNLYYKHESIGKKQTNLNSDDQKSLRYFEKNFEKICKRIKRTERIITGISLGLAAIAYAALVIVPIILYKDVKAQEAVKETMIYVSLGVSFGIGILFGLLFKKKGAFCAFLVNVIAIGLTVALLLYL